MLMTRAWFKVEEFRLEYPPYLYLFVTCWFGDGPTYILHQYIYNLFSEPCIILFSLQFVLAGVFAFRGEIRHFQKQRGRTLAEVPRLIFTTQDHWSVPLRYALDILQTEQAFMVKEYKHRLMNATSELHYI